MLEVAERMPAGVLAQRRRVGAGTTAVALPVMVAKAVTVSSSEVP
jgi:hypothetical protein